MPIEFKKKQAIFSDVISVEEAEPLLEWLQENANAKMHLAACTHLHPAVLQVILAAKSPIMAWPQDVNLCAWLQSAFKSA